MRNVRNFIRIRVPRQPCFPRGTIHAYGYRNPLDEFCENLTLPQTCHGFESPVSSKDGRDAVNWRAVPFHKSPQRLGWLIFSAGLVADILVGLCGWLWLAVDAVHAERMLGILFLGPTLCLFVLVTTGSLVASSIVLGTPGVTIIYVTSLIRRNWSVIGGSILLASALFASAFGVDQIW